MSAPKPQDVDALIADFEKSNLRELHVRTAGFELHLSRDRDAVVSTGPAAVPASSSTPAPVAADTRPAAASAPPQNWPEGATIVTAPYLGTFYRSPKPGAPPFVEVGQHVAADTELCLVEVMKLFTSVRAGVDASVYEILARDGDLIEAGQPLVVLVPA